MKDIHILAVTYTIRGGPERLINYVIRYTVNYADWALIYYKTGAINANHYTRIGKTFALKPMLGPYEKWGHILSSKSIFTVLYGLPLAITTLLVAIMLRPRIVVCNSLFMAAFLGFLKKLIGCKIVLFFHGHVSFYLGAQMQRIVRALCKDIDLASANSPYSKTELSKVFPYSNRIIVVRHWADENFFLGRDRFALRNRFGLNDKFVIAFVGELSYEKHFDLVLQVLWLLKDDNRYHWIIAGTGHLEDLVIRMQSKHRNISFFGYVDNRSLLGDIYSMADVIIGFADQSYLARPVIEAMAVGTPPIVINVPAVLRKGEKLGYISSAILPESVGWMVPKDPDNVAELIKRLRSSDLSEMRKKCERSAKEFFSIKNLEPLVNELINMIKN